MLNINIMCFWCLITTFGENLENGGKQWKMKIDMFEIEQEKGNQKGKTITKRTHAKT